MQQGGDVMMTHSGFLKASLLGLALGLATVGPAYARDNGKHGRNNGWENGNRGNHRGHDNRRSDRRHDNRYAEPRGYSAAPFGFGLFGGFVPQPQYAPPPPVYYPPAPRGYYRGPPTGYYGY